MSTPGTICWYFPTFAHQFWKALFVMHTDWGPSFTLSNVSFIRQLAIFASGALLGRHFNQNWWRTPCYMNTWNTGSKQNIQPASLQIIISLRFRIGCMWYKRSTKIYFVFKFKFKFKIVLFVQYINIHTVALRVWNPWWVYLTLHIYNIW